MLEKRCKKRVSQGLHASHCNSEEAKFSMCASFTDHCTKKDNNGKFAVNDLVAVDHT